jgi:predicted  nucleic acid-binding Zn-ribbon protein
VSDLEALLLVQERDTTIDQLRHRRATLPERAELRDVEARLGSLAAEHAEATKVRDVVAERQANLEGTIAASEARIAEIDKRMYSGEISASRDLQAMTTEIASIKARVSTLEDNALEAMDEREPLDAAVAELESREATLFADRKRLTAAIAEAEDAIDAELLAEEVARRDAAAVVPEGLNETYEKLRARLGGIGAARLEHGTCMGCRMKLPATEIDRIKHMSEGTLVFCDQCGRILVP